MDSDFCRCNHRGCDTYTEFYDEKIISDKVSSFYKENGRDFSDYRDFIRNKFNLVNFKLNNDSYDFHDEFKFSITKYFMNSQKKEIIDEIFLSENSENFEQADVVTGEVLGGSGTSVQQLTTSAIKIQFNSTSTKNRLPPPPPRLQLQLQTQTQTQIQMPMPTQTPTQTQKNLSLPQSPELIYVGVVDVEQRDLVTPKLFFDINSIRKSDIDEVNNSVDRGHVGSWIVQLVDSLLDRFFGSQRVKFKSFLFDLLSSKSTPIEKMYAYHNLKNSFGENCKKIFFEEEVYKERRKHYGVIIAGLKHLVLVTNYKKEDEHHNFEFFGNGLAGVEFVNLTGKVSVLV